MNPTDRTALFYATIISLGGFLFGFDAAVISGVVGFVSNDFALNEWWIGAIVSAPSLGAIVAALVVGPLADYIGRKKVMLGLAVLYSVSAVASALAPDATTLLIARFIGGLAFGTLMLAPIYIAELAPAHLRGRMVSINQLNIVVGFSAAYFANYFILNLSQGQSDLALALSLEHNAWRYMLGLEALPALAYFFFMLLAPESPRYLVLQNRTDEARRILARIAPAGQIDDLVQRIAASSVDATDRLIGKIRDLFRPELRRVLVIGLIAGVAQQSSGINVVFFYAPTIFEQSGVGTNAAFAQATYVGLINVVFTLLAIALIDKIGRKPLMLAGLAGVAVSMALAAYGFYAAYYELPIEQFVMLSDQHSLSGLEPLVGQRFENDVAFKAAAEAVIGKTALVKHEAAIIQAAVHMNANIILIGIMGFVASFAFSLGPVMWVLFSEIFPNRIRGLCIALMGTVNSGVSWLVQFVFPWELATLGSAGTFMLYAASAVVFLMLMVWLMPETRGKSLEQLELELAA
ncbi:MAG: sugar porter family MFS transporter [Pseudomonadota bacterium]